MAYSQNSLGTIVRFALTSRAVRRYSIRAAAVTALAALIPLGLLAAGPASGAAHAAPKPTIVLVHGAWADGSSWSGEVARLQGDGYTVDVAPNPLRGLASDSTSLKDFLATISGPVILAGHSYGGAVIANAATGDANVKALVFVDAFLPDAGESVGQLAGATSILAPANTDPTSVFNLVPFQGAPTGVADAYVLPNLFISGFANDLPRAQAAVLAASQSPIASSAVGEASGTPAWKTIPSYDLIGTLDKAIPAAQQEFMANRAHAHIATVRGSHLALISHPDAVTALIERAAHEQG